MLFFSARSVSFAGSATWKLDPINDDWDHDANWMPEIVPDGPADTATFQKSHITNVSITHGEKDTELSEVVFDPGASAFTISLDSSFKLSISGAGITNNSGLQQTFSATGFRRRVGPRPRLAAAGISFTNSATAGDLTTFVSSPVFHRGGRFGPLIGGIQFRDHSTAGSGTFINDSSGDTAFLFDSTAGTGTFINSNNGRTIFFSGSAGNGYFRNQGPATTNGAGGSTIFTGFSGAGNGTFISEGAAVSRTGFPAGGALLFGDSSAENGTFTAEGAQINGAEGGRIGFSQRATAGNASLTANDGVAGGAGGSIIFDGHSMGGKARVAIFGNGTLDISRHELGVTVGSIEGNGVAFIGRLQLFVGRNNTNTVFSGIVQDGGTGGGSGGVLTKIGTGTLTLSGANTYTGGTRIYGGTLLVDNTSGSGTGFGPTSVDAGVLGGAGTIAGGVTIGTGSGSGAVLSPGSQGSDIGTLGMNRAIFNSDSTYEFQLNSDTAAADQIVAHQVMINGGAQFSFSDNGNRTLPPGTVFTVIQKLTPGKIVGAFANLPGGSTFTSGPNTFRVNYEGGTGNDLTLTVVP